MEPRRLFTSGSVMGLSGGLPLLKGSDSPETLNFGVWSKEDGGRGERMS